MGIRENTLKIYGGNDKDWLGFKFTKKNTVSFHHIIKIEQGGKTQINNLAILSKISHRLLNKIENEDPDLYEEINQLFVEVIGSNAPPNESYFKNIDKLLKKVPDFK